MIAKSHKWTLWPTKCLIHYYVFYTPQINHDNIDKKEHEYCLPSLKGRKRLHNW